MKYPLNYKDEFSYSLLFWLVRFVRYKLTTLSNHQVYDKVKILEAIDMLSNDKVSSIEELESICKKARKAGMIGINTYATPLLKLYTFLTQSTLHSMEDIDEEILSDFLSVETSTLSTASKKNYRIALIGFFGYIDKQNENEGTSYVYDITLKMSSLQGKSGQKLPAFLNQKELEQFLQAIEQAQLGEKVAARNKLIIKLIVYTGIRVSEALALRCKDIFPTQDCYLVQIRGKGNKPRVVMIRQSHIQSLLNAWLTQRLSFSPKNDLLFCNTKGNPLTQSYIYRNVENILTQAGIRKEKNGAHMLRHSFATLLYQQKHDLVMVQEALGHADLNTSRIYTHFDKERLQEVVSVMDNITKQENL
ncbi:tyrosine-type recombinase/integrase [Helicobacter sp. MIT 21-1697]|uniref:tyrosine-type recombinase/integrase n=1 Tax=Helicobacter sp. MIT 21-1697 TaxID=2993733 RepID=UPI00224AA675|nr:tyrosine-type recombinase/integrase [Helicobacter sp. MIT 21-1697]MCX2716642.1 tyrosine-type recombinase/integrase [Helicobacter sp. MIT 21-1697]